MFKNIVFNIKNNCLKTNVMVIAFLNIYSLICFYLCIRQKKKQPHMYYYFIFKMELY